MIPAHCFGYTQYIVFKGSFNRPFEVEYLIFKNKIIIKLNNFLNDQIQKYTDISNLEYLRIILIRRKLSNSLRAFKKG